MEVSYLKVFHEVARCGSFTEAAKHLNISQSSLSRAVLLLEESEGVQLFERSKRGVSLTSVGKEVFLRCESLFQNVRDIENLCRGSRESCEGRLAFAAADHIAKRFFAGRRYAGSKDRRAVRELVWRAIRSFGERPVNGRAAMVALADQDAILAESFDGSGYGAAAIMPDEPRASGALLPAWLNGQFAEPIDEAEQRALMERAPLDVRVNTLLSDRAAVLAELPEAQPLALPDALRLPTDFVLDNHAAFNRGLIEVQDYGSQLIVAACDVKPGQT
ncbi:MAG: LysR family transcriptional regulator, partial [Hyphomicrobium sp.]